MFKKLKRFIDTLKYLKLTQIVYQIKYRIVKPKTLFNYESSIEEKTSISLYFQCIPPVQRSWNGKGEFTFLNLTNSFKNNVAWDFLGYGKLWNYNLQYASYLLQDDIPVTAKVDLITSLYEWLSDGRLLLEPYPASVRSINVIRWLNSNCINEQAEISGKLYAELSFLSRRIEYHLLGNHVLENAFALMMGGAYFSNRSWLSFAKGLLYKELNEQVLSDGAHFELSPMYHQVIFFRLLELIDWYSMWQEKDPSFEEYLRFKACQMHAWLRNIMFANGDIPHFNDSTEGVAYPIQWLLDYSNRLSISENKTALGSSGYRSIRLKSYECKIDFGQLGASYQPGHSHADALSFFLYYRSRPIFIETGTSTYEAGERRTGERQTSAHNTVVIEGDNQSQIYGAFRVGHRAKTKILLDKNLTLSAVHDGYKRRFGLLHQRTFNFDEHSIKITDDIFGSSMKMATAYFHLHPMITFKLYQSSVILPGIGRMLFNGCLSLTTQRFDAACGFNITRPSSVICVSFTKNLSTQIVFDQS